MKKGKDLNLSNIKNKEILIGGAAVATVTTVAMVCNKVSKKKKAIKEAKDIELNIIVNDLEDVASKIVELSKDEEHINILNKEKKALKDNYVFKR